MELKDLISKWEDEIAMHRRVVEDPLMWTKEDRLRASHQIQAICALLADVKKLNMPNAVLPKETLCKCKTPKDTGWYDDARKCNCGGIFFDWWLM
jgi:hypothetical protein